MTDWTPARGPDFLPYPLPAPPPAPVAAASAPPPAVGAWAGLTPWGLTAVTAGGIALFALVVISLLSDHRKAGALVATLAAVVAVAAGVKALPEEQPESSRSLVKGGMGTGVVSAVISLLLLLLHHSSVAEQPPVRVPQPVPSVTQSPLPAPSPTPSPSASPQTGPGSSPSPRASGGGSVGVLPPGSDDLFGVPTQPDPPLTQAPTDKGTLTGKVVNTAGQPLSGVLVTVTRADPTDTSDSDSCPLKVTTTTNAAGRYSLQLCQLGDNLGYHVVISAGSAGAMTNLFVNSGQTTVYNVILAIRRA